MAMLTRALFTRFLARPRPWWLAWLVVPSLFACGAENLKPKPPAEPSDVYWSLTLDHQAITMGPQATYDTLTITATPRNVAGEALTGLPAPTYLSRDMSKVTVTPEGLVRVVGSGFEPVWIIATLVSGNVRHVDSLRVRSLDIDPVPVLATLSIQPLPPDSAKRAVGTFVLGFPLPMRAADANGVPIADLMVSFRSLDPAISTVDETTGVLHPITRGEVIFTGSATLFGTTKTDTLRYRIGFPVDRRIGLSTGSSAGRPAETVGVGGVVFWYDFQATDGFSVDFEGPDLSSIREAAASPVFDAPLGVAFFCQAYGADCTSSGNIVVTPPSVGAARMFTAPGTYYYHASPYGVVGRIDVIDER